MVRPPESSDPNLRFRPLEVADAAAVARIWNDTYGADLPADPVVMEQVLASTYGDPELQWVALEEGDPIGFAWGRDDRAPWAKPGIGYLSAVAVAGHARGRGIGTALVDAVARELQRRGCSAIRLGTDPDHLLAGVPSTAPPSAWAFFRRRGFVFGSAEFDLHLDLRDLRADRGVHAHPLPDGFTVVEDAARAVAFVAGAFPGRWHDEVARYADAGVPLLALVDVGRTGGHTGGGGADSALPAGAPAGSEAAGSEAADTVAAAGPADGTAGFCAVFPPDAPFVGPSLIWRQALSERAAGLGPIGIAEDRRGRGVGLAFFAEACRWLRARGSEEVVINWTTLASFYGRAGARVWRTYQRAEAPLGGVRTD